MKPYKKKRTVRENAYESSQSKHSKLMSDYQKTKIPKVVPPMKEIFKGVQKNEKIIKRSSKYSN